MRTWFRAGVGVLVVVLFAFLAAPGQSPAGKVPDPAAAAVDRAVSDLENGDYVAARAAIRSLEKNLGAPNILTAAAPLAAVAGNRNGRRDSLTRSMAVPVLFRIGTMNADTGPGRLAREEVLSLLHSSPSDMVRGTCADVIAASGYQDAIPDLEAALDDPSVYTRDRSCRALLRLSGGAIHFG